MTDKHEEPDPYAEIGRFSDRLREVVGEESARAFAARAGKSQTGFRTYLIGKSEPTREVLIDIARAGRVAIEWLVTGQGPKYPGQTAQHEALGDEFGLIPLYDAKVSAGNGSWTDGATVLTKLAFTKHWLRKMGVTEKQCSAVRIDGDSMEPTLSEGDMVLIDHQQREVAGDSIYVIRLDQHLYAKRLRWVPGGMLEIISDNHLYPPMKVEAAHLPEIDIIGKVIYRGGTV